jgi:KDEL-tailed cysteine endopeptidase
VCACDDFGSGQTPQGIDWRDASKNSKNLSAEVPITDQGNCGSCWAFADTALLEIYNYLTNPSQGLQKFAEQQILDCNPMRYGCNGGWDDLVFTQWMIPKQIKTVLRANYPYTARRTKC